MRIAGHHILRPESADPVARSVELCESRELRPRSPVSVRSEHPRKMNPYRPHIRRVPPHPPEIVLDPSRVRADVPVLEMSRHHADTQQLRFIAGRQRFQVLLKLRQINRRVRRHLGSVARCKQRLARGCERLRHLQRHDSVGEGNWHARLGRHQRLHHKRQSAGHKIVLPQIRQDGGDRSARVHRRLFRQRIIHRRARRPAVPIQRINRLRIVQKLLCRTGRQKIRRFSVRPNWRRHRSPVVRFLNPGVHFIAQPVIDA